MNGRLATPLGEGLSYLGNAYIVVPIGATGAVGTPTFWSSSIFNPLSGTGPLTRTGVGTYTANFQENWAGGLIAYSILTQQGTIAATDGLYGIVTATAITTAAAGAGTITFQMQKSDGTGAAGEIRNGAILQIWFALKNVNQNP